MTKCFWRHLKTRHGWRSVDECSVLYKEQDFFSFRDTVHLLFSFLLVKTIKSVFLPRFESLKLNHDTNYLMKSEDTVEDPLMSVQFFLKKKSFFFSCYSPSTVFIFIVKDALICISTTLCFKTKAWHKLFADIWRQGWRSVDECSVLYKEQDFFSFSDTVPLLFSYLLLKTIKSLFLPRYESLKLNHDTNYLMTSEDTFEDPLMSVQFYLKNKSFFFSCYGPSTVFIFIARDA